MKKLLLTTALMAFGGTAGYAQDGAATFRSEADPMEIHASNFIGMRVYTSEAGYEGDASEGAQGDWEDVGEINDVILSRDGSVQAVLVDIGGFLGMGERQVAVDMSSVKFVADDATPDDESDFFLVMNAPRASLEEAPEYSWDDRAAMNTEAGMAEEPAAEGEAAAAETEMAAEGETAATEGEMAAEGELTTEGEAMEGDAAAEAEMTPDATDTAAADTGTMAVRDPIVREGYVPYEEADLNTENLTGAPVYDANDEWIGEVSELLINTDGEITDAIVDVGGFLGIGEKPVQLGLGDMDILRDEAGTDLRVYVSMTEAELEALPTYDN